MTEKKFVLLFLMCKLQLSSPLISNALDVTKSKQSRKHLQARNPEVLFSESWLSP